MMTEAVEKDVVQAVGMAMERPRSRRRFEVVRGQILFHRSIVAERGRREQYDGLWSDGAPNAKTFGPC